MENQNNPQQTNQDTITISKKSLYIAICVLVLLLGIGGYFILSKNNNPNKNNFTKTDSTNIKKDSANLTQKDSITDQSDSYTLHRVIAHNITLPSGHKLNFGSPIFVDNQKSTENDIIIYLNNPVEAPSTKSFPISIDENIIISDVLFEDFKNNFSLSPYNKIPPAIKKILLNENGKTYQGYSYKITQNADRAHSTLVSGDFDNDGTKDIAVILDDNEKQASRLVIIGVNQVTNKPYLAFSQNYTDKMKLVVFGKEDPIYMNSTTMIKSPKDGVFISTETDSWAVLYDDNSQKFKSYHQSPVSPFSE